MLLSRLLIVAFIALVSAKPSGKRYKRAACKPQQPLQPQQPYSFLQTNSSRVTTGQSAGSPATGGTTSGQGSGPQGQGNNGGGSSSVQVMNSAATNSPASGGFPVSFTQYGTGDAFGSGSCASGCACGTCGGGIMRTAAISQAFYGAGPGEGAGNACNNCYRITMNADIKGNPIGPITTTVRINNLCPRQGNPLCAQETKMSSKNDLGGYANFDLCRDDGTAALVFGSMNVGVGVGTAESIACPST